MRGTFIVCAQPRELWREAARRIAAALAADGEKQHRVAVALSGGSTPRPVYELLAGDEFRPRIPWNKIHFFWGDERLVPLDHPESNYRLAREALLARVLVPRENIHPISVYMAPRQASENYEQELRHFFRTRKGVPSFDLILLGVGADGHTAALFPGAPPEAKPLPGGKPLTGALRGPGGISRVTLTLPVLNAARRVFFLVTGEEKAAALARAVAADPGLPAGRVAPAQGELVWLVDAAAASRLQGLRVER